MSDYRSYEGFKWLENAGNFDASSISWKGPIGCIFEVDLEYPDELHVLHSDYRLAPEKLAISYDMLPDYCKKNADEYRVKVGDVIKLVPNLVNKATYVLHYRNLELCLSLGMKLTKILSFLMTASYLSASYTFDSQVSLSSCMIIKRGLFFFLNFC